MNRFTGSIPAKTAAILLVILAFAALTGSLFGIGYLYEQGCYDDCDSYYESQSLRNIAHQKAYEVIWRFEENPGSTSWLEFYGPTYSNFSFEIATVLDPTRILLRNQAPEAVGYRAELLTDRYVVRYMVSEPLVAEDDFLRQSELFNELYPQRWAFLWIGAGSALLVLILLVFLFCAAGRRKGVEGIVLGPFHRIPLDLYVGLALLVATVAVIVPAVDYGGPFSILDAALYVAGGVVLLLILLSLLLTLAARIKAGKWWENTLVWRCFRLAGKALRAIGRLLLAAGRHIPLFWKTAVGFCVAALVQFVLAGVVFASYYSVVGLLLLFLFDLLLLVAVSLVAINLHRLQRAAEHLAAGEVGLSDTKADARVDTGHLFGDFRRHGENLNRIREGMHRAVEQRMKSERLKTELITNVSHDIKTPLTSIVNYVDLLKKETLDGQAGEYVEVLDRQSQRLRKLTDDLVEASKASTGNLAVSLERTDLGEVVRQALGEYAERMKTARLEPIVTIPESAVQVLADGRLMWRVLDNLLGNALKYSLTGTRVYLDLREAEGEAVLTVKNISSTALNVDASELLERFVRGDTARSTEGSGLGLNIARSLVELQKGRFALSVDGDLFKAEIRFGQPADGWPVPDAAAQPAGGA